MNAVILYMMPHDSSIVNLFKNCRNSTLAGGDVYLLGFVYANIESTISSTRQW